MGLRLFLLSFGDTTKDKGSKKIEYTLFRNTNIITKSPVLSFQKFGFLCTFFFIYEHVFNFIIYFELEESDYRKKKVKTLSISFLAVPIEELI